MNDYRYIAFATIMILMGALPCHRVAAEEPVNFGTTIYPILQKYCFDCHGDPERHLRNPEKGPRSGLRLDTPEHIRKGSENGPVYVEGKSMLSPLYRLVALPEDHDDRMPPKGKPLTRDEVAAIKRWIKGGPTFVGWPPVPADPKK